MHSKALDFFNFLNEFAASTYRCHIVVFWLSSDFEMIPKQNAIVFPLKLNLDFVFIAKILRFIFALLNFFKEF